MPDDITELLGKAGMADGDISGLRVIPVDIDNTQGSDTAGIYYATAVTGGGEQHELHSLIGYLHDAADASGTSDADYDTYVQLWNRADQSNIEVAPTAMAVDYLVPEGAIVADGLSVTYFEI